VGIVSRSQGGGGGGALAQVQDQVLGGAAATIDFSGIAAVGNHLLLLLYIRGDTAATQTTLFVTFNGDSGANYHGQSLRATGATVTGSDDGAAAATRLSPFLFSAGTAPANAFGTFELRVLRFAGAANQKTLIGYGYDREAVPGAGAGRIQTAGGQWLSNAAVNRITLTPAAGNFVAGCQATLYTFT
jgi:hypothetical protein